VLYTPERLTSIAAEAAKQDSIFSLDDRLGLVHDAFALAKAGLAKVSSALTLVDLWTNEKECMYKCSSCNHVEYHTNFYSYLDLVWAGIAENLGSLRSVFWEYPEITEKLNVLRRVRKRMMIETLDLRD